MTLDEIMENFHPNVIMRNMIYDAVDEPINACRLMNLPGITEDGDELERKASAGRIERLNPLIPMILVCTEWMAKVITEIQIDDLESQVQDEMREDVNEAVTQVIRSGLVATLSAFFEIGLIDYPEFDK